jgi:hypothetical protein
MKGALDLSGREVMAYIQGYPDAEVIVVFVFE